MEEDQTMIKKSRMLMLLTVLALVAAACGGGEGGDTTATEAPEAPAETSAPETTEAAPETTEAAPETTEAMDENDLGGRIVTIGVENNYLPFNFIPIGETEGQGWDYDAWIEICNILNCVPEFVEAAWPAVIEQVGNGEIDTAADGISITDERKEIVDFSNPYMVVTQKFIVHADDDRFSSADDIVNSDAIIATQVGTTNYELVAGMVDESRIQAFEQFPLAIQALVNRDVDVVIIDDAAGLGYIGVSKETLKTIDDPLQSDPLGFIYQIGSDLVGPVNYAIQTLIDNGRFEIMGEMWFGPDFDLTYDDICDGVYKEEGADCGPSRATRQLRCAGSMTRRISCFTHG
jgi:polar amino acid transport system substrate-binding protein